MTGANIKNYNKYTILVNQVREINDPFPKLNISEQTLNPKSTSLNSITVTSRLLWPVEKHIPSSEML